MILIWVLGSIVLLWAHQQYMTKKIEEVKSAEDEAAIDVPVVVRPTLSHKADIAVLMHERPLTLAAPKPSLTSAVRVTEPEAATSLKTQEHETFEDRMLGALELLEGGSWEEAEEILIQLNQEMPSNIEVLEELADIESIYKDNYEQAMLYVEQGIDVGGLSSDLLMIYKTCAIASGQELLALDYLGTLKANGLDEMEDLEYARQSLIHSLRASEE